MKVPPEKITDNLQQHHTDDSGVTALRVLFSISSVGVGAVVILVLVSGWSAVGAAAGIAIGVVGAITTGALAAAATFAGRLK